ncbi:MAG: hypothetical protein SNJ78_06130 [Spirochaetales bacterium]
MIRRIGWLLCCLFILTSALYSQRAWEGTATVARYGEFPPSGMFGLSNSFERNSIVDVENLNTGKQARIVITGRVVDPTIFLVVSEEAAQALGMGKTDIARVRVSPVVTPGINPSLLQPELPLSPDPDMNPSARVGSAPAEGSPSLPPPVIPTTGVESPTSKEPAPSTIVASSPPDEPTAPPEAVPPAPSTAPSAEPSILWKEPSRENPLASMEKSLQDRDKEPFSSFGIYLGATSEAREVASKPEEPKPIQSEPSEKRKAESAAIPRPSEVGEKPELPFEVPLAESLKAAPVPQEIQKKGELEQEESKVEILLALEPAEERPPVLDIAPSSEKVTPEKGIPSPTFSTGSLQKGVLYLQIGAFTTLGGVQELWNRFHMHYPMVILKDDKILRVLVGPLSKDEKGIIYNTFRSLGFRDAFLLKSP